MVKGYQIARCAGGYEVFSDDYGILDGEFESYDEACSAAHEHAASVVAHEFDNAAAVASINPLSQKAA